MLVQQSLNFFSVPQAPVYVYAEPVNQSGILVRWSHVSHSENITGYMLFHREYGQDNWRRNATSRFETQFILGGLKYDTLYTVRVVASMRYGNGLASHYFDLRTKEGGELPCFSNLLLVNQNTLRRLPSNILMNNR